MVINLFVENWTGQAFVPAIARLAKFYSMWSNLLSRYVPSTRMLFCERRAVSVGWQAQIVFVKF